MIELQGINKSYARPQGSPSTVLREIDLSVQRGEFLAVEGPSGSGKSTLMNIMGLLDRPDSGSYRLLGRLVADLSGDELARMRNRNLGFVFQQFHLLPRTTAVENVLLPLVYSDARNPTAQAIEALCRVGLEDRLDHTPSELSGGQQQRVAIARALVNHPEVILADEPTGNLDRESAADVMALLESLHETGATIVLITHDRELARRADRTVRIEDGQLHEAVRLSASTVGGSR